MHQIQNQFLQVSINEKGAELSSVINLSNKKEYIWQGNPDVWGSRAPNLFPIIGSLKDGFFLHNQKKYELPKHGFIRNNPNLVLENKSDDKLTFSLEDSEETFRVYPFKFRYEISFQLEGKSIIVTTTVSNKDTDPIYFSLGGHPAFNVPLFSDETYSDYFLKFEKKQDLNISVLTTDGLIKKGSSLFALDSDEIRLHSKIFEKDALIFKDIPSKKVELISRKYGAILAVTYEDFENLGIWAKPDAPFVCIEPWIGIADYEDSDGILKSKVGIRELMPSKKFSASYSIQTK
ncbi:MAG TPA: aldose 1-epimerase family protein [Salinimicrobium sp.]|nr:aldose 1-epimerase family protein [Salinimicrobium sp.]